MTSQIEPALRDVISTFNELNSSTIEELDSEPSPLEFMRFVSRNSPFVIRGAASSWKATRQWSSTYLRSALAGQTVNVAVTPHGWLFANGHGIHAKCSHFLHYKRNGVRPNQASSNADAPTYSPKDGVTVLAKPHEESQMFDDFLTYLMQQETDKTFPEDSEVRYAQTRQSLCLPILPAILPFQAGGSTTSSHDRRLMYAQKDIPFARIALQRSPDAVNLWIGNSRSVTATHKDNFENIFVQVIGRKHFVLLPPICHPCMNEALLTPATYVRDETGLSIRVDEGADLVPFVTWDPDDPQTNSTAFSRFAQPMRVTLNPGDMLYLPAMW
ncbi:Transcription factor jumonji/aspartyl beta-hydroxylase [Metarhizium robertsii ARSEF 23]|uniref:Transcription factor jumonji/aspartyl beta-hydroxylase n=1 Tax=Metarhizium robertsii (strain ARSEF 23 / ATCC MYA-3075) TaxID=655844 RepID=E9F3S1_METRA|nr:Transcription factor jumonji/aspartyl beta-hydroxylase [Metarhizium robertsii ARSEF 23]EFY97607.1 Transcription factor jumonji/aspartyl beta-hydroxylase [Metarhizium robertsii ARSEF 23]